MIIRRIAGSLAGAVLLLHSAGADAACYSPQQQLPAQTVNGFLGNPSQLLSQFPNGGAQLVSQVRDLVASDPAALPAVVGLLGSASKDQLSAIGSGLGQAARICTGRDQAFATEIQQAVAASGNKDVSDAYAAVTLDVPIGGIGAGGGGGTGTGGPTGSLGTGTFGPAASALSSFGTTNRFSTLSGPTVGSAGGGGWGTTTTTTTTAFRSVSRF